MGQLVDAEGGDGVRGWSAIGRREIEKRADERQREKKVDIDDNNADVSLCE